MRLIKYACAGTAGVLLVANTTGYAATPSNEQMYRIIQQQNQRIEALERDLSEARGADPRPDTQALESKVEAQQAQINALADRESQTSPLDKVSIGGYGEMHYNNIDADNSDNDLDAISFHRFVLAFGYDFTDRLRFSSELEIENAVIEDDAPGAVEVEQAYIQYDVNPNASVLGGLFLTPLGILNETHEPTTFYGVERNDVESVIVPTTYRVGGAQWTQRFGRGFQADVSIHEGLKTPTDGDDAFRVRDGRQSNAEATAKDLAYTARLKYAGIPGVELGGAVQYESDASQQNNDGLGDSFLWEIHTVLNRGIFGLRALYAQWNLDINERTSLANGVSATQINRGETQQGWYIEPSIRPLQELGFYTRYEDVEGARARDVFTQWEGGLNYWPHPDVVLKVDYRLRNLDLASQGGRDFNALDLGIGYQF